MNQSFGIDSLIVVSDISAVSMLGQRLFLN